MKVGYFRSKIHIALLLIAFMYFSCIPSQPPQNTSNTSSTPPQVITPEKQPEVGKNEEVSPQNSQIPQESQAPSQPSQAPPQKSRQTLNIGDPGKGIPYSVQITPLANEEGYAVQGSFGLSGTITRPEKDKDLWVFAGQFEFPSEKYKLGRIDYNIMNAPISYLSGNKTLPPDFSAQVFVLISLTIPPDAKDEKGEFKVPFKIEMPLPKKSEFVITMVTEI